MSNILFCLILLAFQSDSSTFYVQSVEANTVHDSRYIFERVSRIVPPEKLVRMSDIECLVTDLKASGLFQDVTAEVVSTGPRTRKVTLNCVYHSSLSRTVITAVDVEGLSYINNAVLKKELARRGIKPGIPILKFFYITLERRINSAFRNALPPNLAKDFSGWTCLTLRSDGAQRIRVVISADCPICETQSDSS